MNFSAEFERRQPMSMRMQKIEWRKSGSGVHGMQQFFRCYYICAASLPK